MIRLFQRLWALLSSHERWQLIGLSGMVTLMGFAQLVGVASIVPFVSVLIDPESAQSNPRLQSVFNTLNFGTIESFLLFLALMVMGALLVANGLLAVTQWLLIRFGWTLQYRLSRRLLEAYLARPYDALLGRNSADTGKNVLEEAGRLATGVIIPLLQMTAFSVAGLFVLAGLFWANPALTGAVIGVLAGGYGVVYFFVRRILTRNGERRMRANTDRFKAVNEAFGGLKEIKVLGREPAALARYDQPAMLFARTQTTLQIIGQMPRYAMEVLAAGLVLVLAVSLTTAAGTPIQDVAPTLALYGFAAQRLLPFLQQVYVGASQVRSNMVVVDAVYRDMESTPRSPHPARVASTTTRLPFRRELRMEGVSYWYPHASDPAVREITVSIRHRSFVAFVGPTGAGKTTLVDIILGLLQADDGVVTVDGVVLDEQTMRSWQNNLGYVPQDIYLTDESIAANIAFGIPPEERSRAAIEDAARIANIHDFIANDLPEGYDTLVGERGVRLSGGQRQRIGIARALYHDPEVLVLDEATSNLDQGTERAVHTAIEQVAAAKTVILVAHRLFTTRRCDVLYLLDQGRVVAHGTYETLLADNDRFRAMAGVG